MKKLVAGSVVMAFPFVAAPLAFAEDTASTEMNIEVTDGVLTVDITNNVGASVVSPGFAIGDITTSFVRQQPSASYPSDSVDKDGDGTGDGTYEWIVVSNPTSTKTWDLNIAATRGAGVPWLGTYGNAEAGAAAGECAADLTETSSLYWDDLNTNTTVDAGECAYSMNFNTAAAAGVGYLNVDATSATTHEATIDPATGAITGLTDSPEGITVLGSATNFESGVTDSITIFSAGSTSDDYSISALKNILFTQNVPPKQEADTYTLDLTLTVN